MNNVRMHVILSQDLDDFITTLAHEEGVTKTEMLRRALSVLKTFKQQKSLGRKHLGFTSNPKNLEAELVGILFHD